MNQHKCLGYPKFEKHPSYPTRFDAKRDNWWWETLNDTNRPWEKPWWFHYDERSILYMLIFLENKVISISFISFLPYLELVGKNWLLPGLAMSMSETSSREYPSSLPGGVVSKFWGRNANKFHWLMILVHSYSPLYNSNKLVNIYIYI